MAGWPASAWRILSQVSIKLFIHHLLHFDIAFISDCCTVRHVVVCFASLALVLYRLTCNNALVGGILRNGTFLGVI